jgi:hypothetical protein
LTKDRNVCGYELTGKPTTGNNMPDTAEQVSHLELGWQVTPALIPSYWLSPGAKVGKQLPEDLLLVPGGALGCHTAIVAQSGSGKSFFLGRLIEELLLKTKAQCVILDPNADFRRMDNIVSEDRWSNPQYDHVNERGFLPTEEKQAAFADVWGQLSRHVFYGPGSRRKSGAPLVLNWGALRMEFFSEDLDPMNRGDLFHCHEFVRAVLRLYEQQGSESQTGDTTQPTDLASRSIELLDKAKALLVSLRGKESREVKELLEKEFESLSTATRQTARRNTQLINRAAASVGYISHDVAQYYFGKATQYVVHGIVRVGNEAVPGGKPFSSRLLVCDLPSFPDSRVQHLAVHFILHVIWERAKRYWETAMAGPEHKDTRVPTFIVIDEAHNLLRRDTENLADVTLREQFRQIAAEGRKYGLFLILCTQRPDKIDPLVVSECENFAVLKLGSRAVLEKTRELFGLEDIAPTVLSKCLDFRIGRAMLIGRWAGGVPKLLYTAMRRTVEGGRSLREGHWAVQGLTNNGTGTSAIGGTLSVDVQQAGSNKEATEAEAEAEDLVMQGDLKSLNSRSGKAKYSGADAL